MRMLSYLMFFFVGICSAQNKTEKYYDDQFRKIPKDKFEYLLTKNGYRANQYEIDGQISNILYQTKTKGKLTEEEFKNVKSYLSKMKPLQDGLIVIVFYPGKDSCNETDSESGWSIFDKDYQKELKKLKITNSFWLFKDDEDLKYYHPKKINWIKDNERLIEKTFFKMHYPCFSSVVIDENGNYISNLGEFGKIDIINDIKELKNKKASN